MEVTTMKRLILGMSMKRKDLAEWIDNHTWQAMVALAQLYLFPQGNRIHWRKEVWEKFSEMYTLKKTHQFPDSQFILDNSWGLNKKYINDALQRAMDKEDQYEPIKGWSYDEFYNIVKDYFTWLASYLSCNHQIPLHEVKHKLDRLGLDEVDLRVENR